MPKSNQYSLLNNSRFYILVSSLLLSLIIICLVRLNIPSDQLFYIRIQQLFGLFCIFYWYTALAISPLGYVIGKQRTKHLEFARRAIGVSAAYFAVLHAGVAVWAQLGGITGILSLSALFQWSLAAGLFGVIVLSLMAATSFDAVIKFMTFRRWKWLHRLVYAAGILAVLHIWSIGTHVGYGGVQILAAVALIILSGLEMFRIATLIQRRRKQSDRKDMSFFGIFTPLWAIWIVLILLIPTYVDTYRSTHEHESGTTDSKKHADGHSDEHAAGHEE